MKRAEILLAPFLCAAITGICVVQLATPLAAQSPPARGKRPISSSKPDGVITGRVIADDGRPLSDVVILAEAIGVDIFESQRTESNDEGDFKLMGLKPGAYKIDASLPGYVSLRNASGPQFYRIGANVTIRMTRGGVITGRVTKVRGEPLENVSVNLFIVRDLEGRDASSSPLLQEVTIRQFMTDDRGVYRAYGLLPGVYAVSVIDIPVPQVNSGSIPHDSPTYYPSDKREATTEVTVRSGEEVTGVNIRHRSERGYSIIGVISGYIAPPSDFGAPVVLLIDEASKEIEGGTYLISSLSFGLHGVPDGVYELRGYGTSGLSISAPLHITVKGADITGLNLRLLKTGSISGRVVVESPKPGEGRGEKSSIEEIFLQVKKSDATDRNQGNALTAINEKGDFVRPLEDGVYRIIPDLPGDNWYIRAITRTAKEAPNKTIDVARDGVTVKPGENLTGIEVSVAEGAARLRGRIAVADETQTKEGRPAPSRWRVYLVPSEETAAENVLRYAETGAQSDASFELKHIAPGNYYLLAQKILEKDLSENQSRLAAWDNIERAKLRSEAQALKQEIELRPYQQINDYLLHPSAKRTD
jgi:hypothetical protein